MIGNIGFDPNSNSYIEDAACSYVDITNKTFLRANETCVNVFGNELDMLQVADVLTVSEIIQFILIVVTTILLSRRAFALQQKADVNVCTVTDYAVMIEGLPKVTDHSELVHFFSGLYPLDKPDWRGRPPVSGAVPVSNILNTGDKVYLNTWVAELFVFRKMGAFIHAFMNKQVLTTKLLRARAMIKMYSEGTKHAGGHNESKRK